MGLATRTVVLSTEVNQDWEVFTMIEWGSASWGGNVHHGSNGSWATDKHGNDSADADADK
jgi:hypothetical protein